MRSQQNVLVLRDLSAASVQIFGSSKQRVRREPDPATRISRAFHRVNCTLDKVVGNFCRSDGGCLRTILWKRDRRGTIPSTKLPPEKFDPAYDQAGPGEQVIPLLCQEPCNLLVNECRKAVKGE